MKVWAGLLLGLAVFAAALFLSACGDDDDGSGGVPSDAENLLGNGGFEDGLELWSPLRADGSASPGDVAMSGGASVRLELNAPANAEASVNGSAGVSQDVMPDELPEVLAGSYRVDEWARGTARQYVSVTVAVFGRGFQLPNCPGGGPCPNYQLRYILGGVTSDPLTVENGHFVYLNEDEDVRTGEWISFQRNFAEDFEELWGSLPDEIDIVRVIVDVRYNERQESDGPIEAEVYFDDVYLGPGQ